MKTEQEKPVEFIEEESAHEKRGGLLIGKFLTGEILQREDITKLFPFILFLVVLIIIYTGIHYRYDQLMRQEQQLRQEVKNMRAEAVTTAATLMQISRQSEVLKLVNQNGLGLEESTTPPKNIK